MKISKTIANAYFETFSRAFVFLSVEVETGGAPDIIVQECNDVFAGVFNASKTQLIGTSFSEFLSNESYGAALQQLYLAIKLSEPAECELMMQDNRGGKHMMQVEAFPIDDDGKEEASQRKSLWCLVLKEIPKHKLISDAALLEDAGAVMEMSEG